ncbi:MAG: YcgL domain-containing protein [Natronospirillum sp.]
MTAKQLVSIYKSPRKMETYLYVDRAQGLTKLPEGLLEQFGRPQLVTHLLLTKDRKLARTTAEKVLAQIAEKGYYLQMPPVREDYMLDLHKDTSERYEGPL